MTKLQKVRKFINFWFTNPDSWMARWDKFTKGRKCSNENAQQILMEILSGVEDCDWDAL